MRSTKREHRETGFLAEQRDGNTQGQLDKSKKVGQLILLLLRLLLLQLLLRRLLEVNIRKEVSVFWLKKSELE